MKTKTEETNSKGMKINWKLIKKQKKRWKPRKKQKSEKKEGKWVRKEKPIKTMKNQKKMKGKQ